MIRCGAMEGTFGLKLGRELRVCKSLVSVDCESELKIEIPPRLSRPIIARMGTVGRRIDAKPYFISDAEFLSLAAFQPVMVRGPLHSMMDVCYGAGRIP
jgi:hypothetical protein